MPQLTRRGFLKGCSAAIAAMSGATFQGAVFGSPEDEPNQDILITIFLRGGADVLNMLPPIGGDDRGIYELNRGDIAIPTTGDLAALPIGTSSFGMHNAMGALHELYGDGKLAIVQATGMHEDTRSHFEAMSMIEHGTPGAQHTVSGWMARHFESATNLPSTILMPALAMGDSAPTAFATSNEVVAMDTTDSFHLDGHWRWRDAQRAALRRLYAQDTSRIHMAGIQAMNGADLINLNAQGGYTPEAGVVYPNNSFGRHLQTIAQMVKLQLGLRMATVDLGGWDTHDGQGSDGGGYFYDLLTTLSSGLSAFYNDLNVSERANYTDRVTVVVMSEFGRRLRQNDDEGTDHGHGGAMFVLGGQVNGGLYGTWPGLETENLYDNADLEVTTDYRQVLSELLIRRLGNSNLGHVFPGYDDYAPLGVVQGEDMEPVYSNVPTAVDLLKADTASRTAGKVATVAGVGLAATAGLVALRERET